MSWRDRLQPASFRGVPFVVSEHEHGTGRRLALHVYPGRDRPWPEDMGRRAREFEIEALLVGRDYIAATEALLAACEAPGPGLLVHPYRGRHLVSCGEVRQRESTREGRMARFTLSFVEAGSDAQPAAEADPAADAAAAAGSAREAVGSAFVEDYGSSPVPDFLVAEAEEDARAVAAELGAAAAAAVRAVSVRSPAALAAALERGIAALGDPARLGKLARSPLPALLRSIPTGTASRLLQARGRAALGRAVSGLSAVRAAEILVAGAYETRGSALAARALASDAIDAAAGAAGAAVYRALRALGDAAGGALSATASALPEEALEQPAAVLPALVLAWRRYGDPGRDGTVAAAARAARPGFVPARPFRVPGR